MVASYRITIRKIATGWHKNITRNLTDEAYEKWRERMNKAENGYVITRIELNSSIKKPRNTELFHNFKT
jgi:hypothetical protein